MLTRRDLVLTLMENVFRTMARVIEDDSMTPLAKIRFLLPLVTLIVERLDSEGDASNE